MASRWSDLSRPPLSQARLSRALLTGGCWTEVRVVESTESTNADVSAAALAGAPAGLVVIAEEQRAGRGRLDRVWSAPPRSSLLMSVLLRPPTPPATWPLLPLLAGLAVLEAVAGVGRVPAELKWPNDLLVGERKLAGILAERVEEGVIVGIGLNVSITADERPLPTATSLALEGGVTDREVLAKETLRALARRYAAWRDTDGHSSSVLPPYRERCGTINRQVSVEGAGGGVVVGTAVAVDDEGRLVVRDEAGVDLAFSAGDVTHVRASS